MAATGERVGARLGVGAGVWPGGAVSIVLLPSGEQGENLFELAAEWSGQSLLSPALWVRPERVQMLPDSPPSIRAWVLGIDADREVQRIDVDLFEALAREPLTLVRLLKVRSALPSRENDELQDAIGATVSDYITLSLPSVNPDFSHLKASTELLKVSLISAPTEFQLRQRVEWAENDQGVTLVASPEDRSSPWSGDAFVRDNARFVGFTLMHIATTAGLWNGVPIGSLELFTGEPSTMRGVWMPRVFVNGVMTDGLARRVAAQVLDQAADPSSALIDPTRGVPAEGTSAIPDDRIDVYVNAMVTAAFELDDRKLTYREPEPVTLRPRERVGFWRQLALFFTFAGEKIAWMPVWFATWFRNRFASAANRSLQGDDGQLEVVSGRPERVDSRDRLLLAARGAVITAESEARAALQTPAAASALRSTPRLWTGLRELVFGSLDGSADLVDRGFTPIEDKTPVFGRVSDVLPDADDVWVYPAGTVPFGFAATIGSKNLHEGSTLRERLGNAIRNTQSEIETVRARYVQAQGEYVTATARAELLEKYLLSTGAVMRGPAGELGVTVPAREPAASGDDPFETVRPFLDEYLVLPVRIETLERTGTELGADQEALVAALDGYRAALTSFETWLDQRERSFLWKMLTRMNRTRDRVSADLEQYEARIAAVRLPAPGALVRLRRAFHSQLITSTVVIVLLGTIAVLLPRTITAVREWPPYPPEWLIITVAVALIIGFLLMFLVGYYRGWSQFDRSVSSKLDELYGLSRATSHARSELHRLTSLNAQSLEWLELLAISLYAPWSVKKSWLSSGLNGPASASLPFAMQIAQAHEGNTAESTRLQHSAARSLVKIGWRARAFEEMLAEIGARLGLSPAQLGLDALDHDLPHASNNSRRIVRQNMVDPVLLEQVALGRLHELIAAVQSGALYESRPRVRRVVADPLAALQSDAAGIEVSTEDLEWTTFLTGTLGDSSDPITPLSALGIAPFELQDGHHMQPSTFLLAPARIASTLGGRDAARVHIASYPDTVARPLDVVLRIDLVGPLPLSAVHLWGDSRRSHPALGEPVGVITPPPASPTRPRTGI